jgi:hypothetical protein
MAQKLSNIIKDLLSRKNPDGSRMWTQTTLAAKLGTNQPAVSQMLTGSQWDDHFEVFRKLVSEVEPLAIFDEPLDEKHRWYYMALKTHFSLPEEERNDHWRATREEAEKLSQRNLHTDLSTTKKAKSGGVRRIKTRHGHKD